MSNVRLVCKARGLAVNRSTILNIDPHYDNPTHTCVDVWNVRTSRRPGYTRDLHCCETRNSKLLLMSTQPKEMVIYDPFAEEVVCRSYPKVLSISQNSGAIFPVLKGPDSGIIFYDHESIVSNFFMYMTCDNRCDQRIFITNKPRHLRRLCCNANSQGVTQDIILTCNYTGLLYSFDVVKCRIGTILNRRYSLVWYHCVADFIDCNTFVACSLDINENRGMWLVDKRCNGPLLRYSGHRTPLFACADLYNPYQLCGIDTSHDIVSIYDIRMINKFNSVHQVDVPPGTRYTHKSYMEYSMRQIGPLEFVFRVFPSGVILSTSGKRIEGMGHSETHTSVYNDTWAVAKSTDEQDSIGILLVAERMLFSLELCAMWRIVYCGNVLAIPRYFLL